MYKHYYNVNFRLNYFFYLSSSNIYCRKNINYDLTYKKKKNSQKLPGNEASEFLDLGSLSTMDRQMRCLMDSIDELSQEGGKFNNYQRQVSKLQQDKHKHVQKRVRNKCKRYTHYTLDAYHNTVRDRLPAGHSLVNEVGNLLDSMAWHYC